MSHQTQANTVPLGSLIEAPPQNGYSPNLMMRFRPDASKIYPEYLEVYLRSETVVKYIQRHATGTSGSMKKQKDAYRKQKRGLMQKLLTGQWWVKIAGEVLG